MVLGVVNNEGRMMSSNFFPQCLGINSAVYVEVQEIIVKT